MYVAMYMLMYVLMYMLFSPEHAGFVRYFVVRVVRLQQRLFMIYDKLEQGE